MDRFTRIVLGYHGCEPAFADQLFRGDIKVDDWKLSANVYDWLGRGIYFWEYGPERAQAWRGQNGVIGAIIQLGICLDFMDVRATALLAAEFEVYKAKQAELQLPLLENKNGRNELDCVVINSLCLSAEQSSGLPIQTVRCPFLEGPRAFPGSAIYRESHVQIAVRDPKCILGIFRPT